MVELERQSRCANNALYRINAGPAQRYLVETDPQFVGTRNWLSSDFMLNQLGATASVRQLGDSFYEQQLVQRQVHRSPASGIWPDTAAMKRNTRL